MTTENLFVYDSRDWKAIEAICERLPDFDVEPPFTYKYNQNKTL